MSAPIIPFDEAVARALRAGDHMIRGTAAEGFVRVFAITAKRTVQTAHANHGTSAVVTAALGRLMMGACMYTWNDGRNEGDEPSIKRPSLLLVEPGK